MKNLKFLLLTTVLIQSCQRTSPPLDEALASQESLRDAIGFSSVMGDSGNLEISPSARLRKLSLHLRGLTPGLYEYGALQEAIQNNELPEFFDKKTKEYLSTPYHLGKMLDRFNELFRLKLAEGLPESRHIGLGQNFDPGFSLGREEYNTLGFIFEKIIKENLSWDNLITTRDYLVQSPAILNFSRPTDIDFFRPIVPELPVETPSPMTPKYELIKVPLKPEDNRVGGAITTSRFFSRYSTTNLNKSRGRAAAIFRVFLCDDMRATVETKPEEEEELLKNAFPKKDPRDDLMHWQKTDEDPHSSQPACMACHYKLDPMGKTFINFGNVMATEPAPGALVFKRSDGSLVNLKGKGLGEVLSFIPQQEEYKRCQVNHFWKWFIRGDQHPDEARLAALLKIFDELGHKPNDFIAYLVNQPEFLAHPSTVVTTVNIAQVSPMFVRCDQCHADKDSAVMAGSKIPAFLTFPIGGSEKTHRVFLKEMALKLDLKNNGMGKKMPPENSPWQPTQIEILTIKDWIRQGARGSDNQPTIDEAFAKSILEETTPPPPSLLKGSFKDSYLRYTSTHDMVRLFRQKFPLATAFNASLCTLLNDQNRALLGEPNPLTGELTYPGPSPAYVKYFGLCLLKLINTEMELSLLKIPSTFGNFLGGPAITTISSAPQAALAITEPKKVLWKNIPTEAQAFIARHLLNEMIGGGILKDEELYLKKLTETIQRELGEKSTFEAIAKILFYIGTQDDFLSY